MPPRRRSRVHRAFGCGVDVVELTRFRQAVARGGKAFLQRIFTPQEQRYAAARKYTTMLHLAGRFAAKEAVIKAVAQVDPKRLLTMKHVEIRNDRMGRPSVTLHDRNGHRKTLQIHISLSHVKSVAVASAIAIR